MLSKEGYSMFEKKMRSASRGFIEAMAKGFVRLRISPNTMSFISFLVGMAGAYYIASGELIAAVALIIISGILDAVDGSIARIAGKASKWGAFIDSTFDKVVEIAIFIGIFIFNPELALIVILSISFMMLSSYTNKHIAAFNLESKDHRPFSYVYTFADRLERMAIVCAALILPAFMREILYIYLILLFLSFMHRVISAHGILKEKQAK
jgi:archaetidylinositol phosphate synthase